MNTSNAKIQPEHRDRWAYIYVRQSSVAQVHEHRESTHRQYELKNRARQLGWPDERIEVIDDDLGQSASDASRVRNGFEHLLAAVVTGRVGAILNVEISRLARQDSEGHRLVEVAALTGTLLIDEQFVYDPRLPDDRLMLGIKVLFSSMELRQMSLRLWENKLRKAQRGELRINLPIGLVFDSLLGVCLDPNEQIQSAVRLLFERFRLTKCINDVVRYFRDHGLEFPKHKGGWNGSLEWGLLSRDRVKASLNNPLYAGAYVYGRVTRRAAAKPLDKMHQRAVRLPPQEWAACIWDAFPAYISRAEYESNQAILAHNRLQSTNSPRRRDGAALLSGIVLCGLCGHRMRAVYSGSDNQYITYACDRRRIRYTEPDCQRVPGKPVDQVVAQAVLAALTPAQIELSLAVIQEIERQQAELRHQWELRLENARYAARLAQRRYEQVDPENRLVARNLERLWETHLRQIERLEAEFASHQNQPALALDASQRQLLQQLVHDLPTVWHAETTSWTDRKNLLQLLIADVTLTRQETTILIQIRWHTNELDTYTVPLPRRGASPMPQAITERVRQLSQTFTDHQIAEKLNQDGIQTAQGMTFTAPRVQGLRRRYGIRKRAPNSRS